MIVAAGLLALDPSTITGNSQAQIYDNKYRYDDSYNSYYQEPKNSHVEIQKISCLNDNTNINGIDITKIPQDSNAIAATNEDGTADAANTQNGNGLADRINFERNLVNICVNFNVNEQVEVGDNNEDQTCEDCWRNNLDDVQFTLLENALDDEIQIIINGVSINVEDLTGLCNALEGATTDGQIFDAVMTTLIQAGIITEPIDSAEDDLIISITACIAEALGFPSE
jgi:hypothetical protein